MQLEEIGRESWGYAKTLGGILERLDEFYTIEAMNISAEMKCNPPPAADQRFTDFNRFFRSFSPHSAKSNAPPSSCRRRTDSNSPSEYSNLNPIDLAHSLTSTVSSGSSSFITMNTVERAGSINPFDRAFCSTTTRGWK